MTKRQTNKIAGITYIEVLIALVVLIFGLYALLDLYFTSQRLGERAVFKTQSLYLARGKMAELQAAGPDKLFTYFKQHAGDFVTSPATLPESPNFEWQWGLNQETSDTLRLEVTVARKNFPNSAVKLTAYVIAGEE